MEVFNGLSKREREILKTAYRLGESTAREIQEGLDEEMSYSAVRTFLSNLQAKGKMTFRHDGRRYVWSPAAETRKEGRAAIAETIATFFEGSKVEAIAALLGNGDAKLTEEEYLRLRELIDKAGAARSRG